MSRDPIMDVLKQIQTEAKERGNDPDGAIFDAICLGISNYIESFSCENCGEIPDTADYDKILFTFGLTIDTHPTNPDSEYVRPYILCRDCTENHVMEEKDSHYNFLEGQVSAEHAESERWRKIAIEHRNEIDQLKHEAKSFNNTRSGMQDHINHYMELDAQKTKEIEQLNESCGIYLQKIEELRSNVANVTALADRETKEVLKLRKQLEYKEDKEYSTYNDMEHIQADNSQREDRALEIMTTEQKRLYCEGEINRLESLNLHEETRFYRELLESLED